MRIDDIDFRQSAILLDIDGTLLDIAPTPLAVEVPDRLKQALPRLSELSGGAIAFVSGRPLMEIDHLFAPLKLAAVAGHGAEFRACGEEAPIRSDLPIFAGLRDEFAALPLLLSGVIFEDKGYSLALHYRLAPQHGEAVRKAVVAACARYPAGAIELLPGKAVMEVKPTGFNKGTGIRRLMTCPPFRGRKPVFIGDDYSDESAFAVLPDFSGLGFSVGRKIDGLAGSFPSPADVRDWLYRVCELTGANHS